MDYDRIANELRVLCADIVQKAGSGHPGAAMGLAEIAVVLSDYIDLSPADPSWINRDRLVFSGGHVSALLYSLLHLWGYDVSMHDLMCFRQLDSNTPGHPELGHTRGVDITTGPLGQGLANAIGFSLASLRARRLLGSDTITHKVYCLCGDGDLQEGISYESCSLAGVHNLDNLIIIYDSNSVSIDGDVSIAFREDVGRRFSAQGFDVVEIDGHDFAQIRSAFDRISTQTRPLLIIAKTIIARHAFGMEGSHKTHGAPLGDEVISATKRNLGLPDDKFHVSAKSAEFFSQVRRRGQRKYDDWHRNLRPSKKRLIDSLRSLDGFEIESFPPSVSMSTRASNGLIMNAIARRNPGFIGGSADLSSSNNVRLCDMGDFPSGPNIHFGIREHAMGAISNAFAHYGVFTPFCATFFVFSDYMVPSIRLACLMGSRVFYIFTHDSIGVGEDGATHQPIEQLSHLRAMPNIINWRPCDANENISAWRVALTMHCPQSFILTRQGLPVLDSTSTTLDVSKVAMGAYVISPSSTTPNSGDHSSLHGSPRVSLVASGSEVNLAIKAQSELEEMGVSTQVISMPSYDLFVRQGPEYRKSLFADSKVLALEALGSVELSCFAHEVIIMTGFGSSAPGGQLFDKYGFSVQNVVDKVKEML